MIRATTFAGRRVAVFGLGASGNATALSLIAGGAEVLAWDDGEPSRATAAKLGIPLVDLKTASWAGVSSLLLAPGVPLTHPEPHWVVLKARAAGVEVTAAAEIYARRFADADGRIRATFEIVWLSGWAPHESQQQPLKPGSAKQRLADALKVEERKA